MATRQISPVPQPVFGLESLEPRVLLASNIAAVGFEQGPASTGAFYIEAVLADSGAITGTQIAAGSTMPGASTTPFLSAASFTDNGGVDVTYDAGFAGFDQTRGADFLLSRESPFGFLLGQDTGNDRFGYTLLVERPDTTDLSQLAGTWAYSAFRLPLAPSSGVYTSFAYTGSLNLNASGQGTIIATNEDGGPPIFSSIAVTSTDDNGQFNFANGEVWFANADYSVLIGVDTTTFDGANRHTISIAYRADTAPTPFNGDVYRIGIANADQTTDDPTRDTPAAYTVRLDSSGQAVFFDYESFTDGSPVQIGTGSWISSGSSLVITDFNGAVNSYTITDGGKNLVATTEGSSAPVDSRFGIGVLAADVPPVFNRDDPVSTVQLETSGELRYYELNDDDPGAPVWESVDLFTAAAVAPGISSAITLDVQTFTDPVTGRVSVVWVTDNGLYLFERDDADAWALRRLDTGTFLDRVDTEVVFYEVPGAATQGDEIGVITGINGAGDIVQYRQTGDVDASDLSVWAFVNITTTQLNLGGQVTPLFNGSLTGFATPWNGETIAGLTPGGDLWTVWFAPGLTTWRSLNMSSTFGPTGLIGDTTSWTQSWGGLNIAANNASGEIIVFWWAPALGSNWGVANLTVEATGPDVDPLRSMAAGVRSDGSVVLAGVLDAAQEEVVIYEWDFGSDTWTGGQVTSTLAIGEARPVGDYNVQIDGGDVYVFGTTVALERVVVGLATGASVWTFDILPDIATPI